MIPTDPLYAEQWSLPFIDDPQMSADGDGIDGDAEDSGDHPNFPSFHGTHVAGIIGAVADNNIVACSTLNELPSHRIAQAEFQLSAIILSTARRAGSAMAGSISTG